MNEQEIIELSEDCEFAEALENALKIKSLPFLEREFPEVENDDTV